MLAISLTVTTTLPLVAPSGTEVVIDELFQLVTVAGVPLKVTTPVIDPKFAPVMVTAVPAPPAVGVSWLIDGVKVNNRLLLAFPLTVTTTGPVTAPVGTVATIAPGFQLVIDVDATPPKVTVLVPCDDPKLDPEIVTEVPTAPVAVLRAVITGAAPVTVNVIADDVPAASATVRLAVPAVVIRLAGTAAISCVELTSVVLKVVFPHNTDAPDAKFVPFTVSAKPALPAVTDAGDVLVMLGAPIENVELTGVLPEDEPSGFATDRLIDPAVATRLAGTAACNSVELTKVVVKAVLPDCASARGVEVPLAIAMFPSAPTPETELVLLALPFHSTVDPGTKLDPLTVRVKPALPVVTALGEMPETVGADDALV